MSYFNFKVELTNESGEVVESYLKTISSVSETDAIEELGRLLFCQSYQYILRESY